MSPEEFDLFFQALYGFAPFPWQARLARQVIVEERWPEVLSLPTSAGKTAAIDIAVFALAMQVGLENKKRTAPLRTFFVIDRRIVVDEASDRARKIAAKLRDPSSDPSGILTKVADRLKSLTGNPLHVVALRGGMYRDGSWAKSPIQPAVCVSTVDQVGSRLLFRGYGVSEQQRAIHAGLVGNDSLIIIDEAHLSQPFIETLEGVNRYRGERWAELPPSTPFHVVQMSATPPPGVEPFKIQNEDLENPELGRRINAHKLARLVDVTTDSEDEDANRKKLCQKAAEEAITLAGIGSPTEAPSKKRAKTPADEPAAPVGVVGIVVNRVASARLIFEILNADPSSCHAILLTGRIRPYDRDELLYRKPINGQLGWFPFMEANRERPKLDLPLFVVATQTVEVGANLSFDALVTEIAPLDALRQRFGRLDRLGLRCTSKAVIVARKDSVSSKDDPVYGAAIAETWKWLKKQQTGKGQQKVIDFGIGAFKAPEDQDTINLVCSPRKSAPVMLPAHIDTWVQTSPTPAPDPDPSLFLHGPQSGPADVQIVWRADLPPELLDRKSDDYVTTVAIVPPTSMEALPVPIYAARAWLTGSAAVDVSDVEGESSADAEADPSPLNCIRWRGPDHSELIDPGQVRPGDTIVISSARGGADDYGWAPESKTPVRDVADHCSSLARLLPVLRLYPDMIQQWEAPPRGGRPSLSQTIREVLQTDDQDEPPDWSLLLRSIREWPGIPDWVTKATAWLADKPHKLIPYPPATRPGIALVSRKRTKPPTDLLREAETDQGDFTNEDDTASLTDRKSLTVHCREVQELARHFAHLAGFPSVVFEDLALAGWFHDVGKADPRFQAWLHGGDEIAAVAAPELLAKSDDDMSPRNRAAIRWARVRAAYPAGGRHEVLSVALLARSNGALAKASDRDLVLHLIGTHHGWGRPFVPVVPDPDEFPISLQHGDTTLRASNRHGLERLDSGWTDRFWTMVRRYGYWGLAYLEAILQLADHRCSEDAQETEKKK
ncbi:MAG: type I-U CRISPR-associated helicase/endonuclease Cas3 [Planctomycetes bacterium]|nr:type I-U CRISPR-associated helicase/endonuclease Cas3 [Planctomycetota bacterium]